MNALDDRSAAHAANPALEGYRRARVLWRQLIGTEPRIGVDARVALQYFGHAEYGGWAIPRGCVDAASVVVDVGLGEDISFSEALIANTGCTVHGFDPTPRAIDYVRRRRPERFVLHEQGVAGSTREAQFYLPNEAAHVSGSITRAGHVGGSSLRVHLLGPDDLLQRIGRTHIDLLKLDIEGAEYELLASDGFRRLAARLRVLCIEFHHRWPEHGPAATRAAAAALRALGLRCVWRAAASNEEFTFARV